jgi:hypothetical protein
MAVNSDIKVSWAVTPCGMVDRYHITSTLKAKVVGSSKVVVSNTILHNIIPEDITSYI